MSEWSSVLATYWVLWALDGARFAPRQLFTLIGGGRVRWWKRMHHARLSLPGVRPGSWRVTTSDVPLSLSPLGVCNRPVGAAGRPAESPLHEQAWRWDEVREVGVARGWLFINGVRFCPDTRHVTAPELLQLTRASPEARAEMIAVLMRRWLRPAHLRRRARVLERRTALPARLNAIALSVMVALTIYIVGDIAAQLPARWSERLVNWLPWILLGVFMLHVGAVVTAWLAVRRLKSVGVEKRGAALFSALLLPPQALRLRALAGDGFFPPQHPLALVLAFGSRREQEHWAFNVVGDLSWPIGDAAAASPAREIVEWFRRAWEKQVGLSLAAAKLAPEVLLAAPAPDSPASCRYCPRCRAQFAVAHEVCPNGVPLRKLAER